MKKRVFIPRKGFDPRSVVLDEVTPFKCKKRNFVSKYFKKVNYEKSKTQNKEV